MQSSAQDQSQMKCPLCSTSHERSQVKKLKNSHVSDRDYFLCSVCDLIFLDPSMLPSLEKEKARYMTHQNNPNDLGYKEFLMRFLFPTFQDLVYPKLTQLGVDIDQHVQGLVKVDHHLQILDYGSGPTAALQKMIIEQGLNCEIYDPIFANDEDVFKKQYDFICSTEVFEHFHFPVNELKKIIGLLKPDGFLAVMTQFHSGPEMFASWWYPKDFTHVIFFSENTVLWLAAHFKLKIKRNKSPLFFLQK